LKKGNRFNSEINEYPIKFLRKELVNDVDEMSDIIYNEIIQICKSGRRNIRNNNLIYAANRVLRCFNDADRLIEKLNDVTYLMKKYADKTFDRNSNFDW
jgi:hypothetical protein